MNVHPRPLIALVRPFTLLAPVVGVVCAAGVASAALGRPLPALELTLACLAAAAATGASNAWNQVFDLELDRVDKPHRPLPSGALTLRSALRVGDLLALAAVVGSAFVSTMFLACVSFGLLASWAYSAPPLRLRRHVSSALVAIAVPRGLLVPVAGWGVVAVPDRADPWALGAVAFLFVLGAAATKDFADVEGDRAQGVRTLPIVLGSRRAAHVVGPFLFLPFLLYPVFWHLGWLEAPLGPLLALAVCLALVGCVAHVALRREVGRADQPGSGRLAWVLMYLLLLGSQVGTLLVYVL